VLLAAGVWALYFVGQKTLLQRYGALDLMTYVIWSGTLALLLLVPAVLSTVQSKSLNATISVVYLGTLPTIVAYATWAYVLSQLPVSVAASFLYAVPILAMLLAWYVIGEIPSISMIAGAILAISGVAVVNAFGRQTD
jgi:drug/metabolite transporter (DMT)-like permease